MMIDILYIEDNADNRLLIRRILEAEGFFIQEAVNANQAMEALKARTPDLILMDINLPEVDGYTLTSHLKAHPKFNNIPIVALTANVMQGDKERTIEAGCDGYIQKPIDVDSLPDELKNYLRDGMGGNHDHQ
jgi:two-component system, cell cycle response regulator DivK